MSNAYLSVKTANENDRILSRIGNGLADDELMPVEYDYIEAGYSTIMIEREIGNGSILISSFLIGEKTLIDPVANAILKNITGE